MGIWCEWVTGSGPNGRSPIFLGPRGEILWRVGMADVTGARAVFCAPTQSGDALMDALHRHALGTAGC